jgi:hypothetical protein
MDTQTERSARSSTRSTSIEFDWKSHCFICGEKCSSIRDLNSERQDRNWSMVESAIGTDDNSIYTKVLKEAEAIGDSVLIKRLTSVPNGDLVALEARYHRKKGCLTKFYGNKTNKTVNEETPDKFKYMAAALKLKEEFEYSLMTQMKVHKLSELRNRFNTIAKEEFKEDVSAYKTNYFKRLLKEAWPELICVHQNGKSDLVCSSQISFDTAVRRYDELEQSFQEETDLEEMELELDSDESIVHKAVGILKSRILANTKKMDQEYYSTEELTPAKQKEFIDPLLYRMVSWLSSNDNYANATAVNNEKHETKVIAIASDITSLVSSVNSPKHLGLSVHLYNEFGSRHLVEDMSNLGYGISYSELRMFLSSAAEHVIQTQRITKSGGLVPENISHINDGGQYIVGVADNWDHNEKTVDGKRTTHAMTSILVAPNVDVDMPLPRLPRSPNRSFDKAAFPGKIICEIKGLTHVTEKVEPFN